jgi:EmrB/QacA subfamily drug resistance transporter
MLLALVQFMFALDLTIVNPALPTIKHSLHFSTSGLAWVVNGYALVAGGFLILGGRAADYFGRRLMFVLGTVVFAIASATSGLAQDTGMLVASRFAQGLGEALAAPAALSLVVLLFPDAAERAKAIGLWGAITIMGATLGVVISGVIVHEISWRWVFLVNMPVAAIVVFVVPRLVQESRIPGKRRIDIAGALLITSGLTLAVYGLLNASTHALSSGRVLIPALIGLGLVVAFVASQATIRDPLVPLRFFANRTRVSANFATILVGAGFLVMFFMLTLYMQDSLHYSALKTGLLWGPFGLGLFVGFGISAQLLPRAGVKVGLVISLTTSAVGLYLLSRMSTHPDYLRHILPGMLIMAVGQGITFLALTNASLHQLDHHDAGLGSAVQNTAQQLGGSLGLAVIVALALRHTDSRIANGTSPLVASIDGYSLALKISAAVMLAAALSVALLFERVNFVPPDKLALEAAEADAGLTATGSTDPSSIAASA